MKIDEKVNKALEWYRLNRNKYDSLCIEVQKILETKLKDENIIYNSITCRTKEIESFARKCKKDKYKVPERDIMDISGIRVIAYTNSDIEKICDIITDTFEIDYDNSINKQEDIDVDRFGYISVHYVARLKPNYKNLVAKENLEGLCFEIQVRTILQHAWAEIEHDRNYKFNGVLPKNIKRRLYMIAGVLELVDKEFEDLTQDIETYAKEVSDKTQKGILNIEINSTSLYEYWMAKFDKNDFDFNNFKEKSEVIIKELNDFGITKLRELDKYVTMDIVKEIMMVSKENLTYGSKLSIIGIIRDIMILSNASKYFSSVWNEHWCISSRDVKYFERLGLDIKEICGNLGIMIDSYHPSSV